MIKTDIIKQNDLLVSASGFQSEEILVCGEEKTCDAIIK